MKFGCCVNMLPGAETLAGIAYARPLKELGYDYIELPMSRLAALEERDFETVRDTLADLDLPCRACNDFMPARFQIVGEETTPEAELEAYLAGAFDRLERLGVPVAVFGSPWSRSCPEGFSRARALDQLADFLCRAGDLAAGHGVAVAIEHNNRAETNMLNRYADAAAMARTVDRPNVGTLCDYYHLRREKDSPDALLGVGRVPLHTHIARLEGRRYFTTLEGEEPFLSQYVEVLARLGYTGGVSVEAPVTSPEAWRGLAETNLRTLRRAFAGAEETSR